MSFPFKAAIAMFALYWACATAQAPGDIRVALVIGNSAYTSAPALLNPANDAKAMSDTLRGLGFTVVELRDGSKAQMADAITKVRDALKGKQGVGMLYYAGHGLQMDARNYMVPVDAKMAKAADVAPQTVDVSSVVEAFKAAGNRMNILVLDACRDNPFGGITSGKGLAPLDAPSGTFLAYATAPGNVAEDGDVKTGNGLYTQFLLQELKKPQASIENVFKRVRFQVRQKSQGRQIPWESTSLEDDFQFNDGKIRAMAKPTAQQLQTEFSREKQDWDRINESNNSDDFYTFIQKYPNGTITEAAHARLNLLSRPNIVVQGSDADGKDQSYSTTRYQLGDTYITRYTSSLGGISASTSARVVRVKRDEIAIDETMTFSGSSEPNIRTMLYDAEGGYKGIEGLEGANLRIAPTYYALPPGLYQVGQTWKISYEKSTSSRNFPGTRGIHTGFAKIVERESITVPAGTFQTFRVEEEITEKNVNGSSKVSRNKRWYAARIPIPVKEESEFETTVQDKKYRYTSKTELVKYARSS